MESDSTGIKILTVDSELIFERTFKEHFKGLHAYACSVLRDEVMAEEMVQNVFYKLWEKREQITVQQSLAAYLYRSVYNESLNYLKHSKVKNAYEAYAKYHGNEGASPEERSSLRELQAKIDVALKDLPEQCRTIFQMSRFEELKYREIADRLGLSVKTVENQMGKALKIMRTQLADYLPILVFLSLNLQNLFV